MNKKIGMIGSIINAITVLLFAIFLLIDFKFIIFYSLIVSFFRRTYLIAYLKKSN